MGDKGQRGLLGTKGIQGTQCCILKSKGKKTKLINNFYSPGLQGDKGLIGTKGSDGPKGHQGVLGDKGNRGRN